MKTISLSDEGYEFLKSCKQELLTQDNRSTSNPIFAFMKETEYPTTEEYSDDYIFFSDYLLESCSPGGIREFIMESFDFENSDYTEENIKKMSLEDLEEFVLNEFDGHFRKIYRLKTNELYRSSFSLFESDIEAHVNLNKHNMKDVDLRGYAVSNQRTPKMEKLRKILMELNLGE